MDVLSLQLVPHPNPAKDVEYSQLQICINQTPLLPLIAGEEEEPTRIEFDERFASGEDPVDLRISPGDYMYPTVRSLNHYKDLSFGKARDHFVIDASDNDYDATVLMGCSCGEPGCWMLLVDISTNNDVVTWSNFRQFHRPAWQYGLGPYRFEAKAYEQEINRFRRCL